MRISRSGVEPVDVCLTVDVEFSVAGAFDDPVRFAPLAEPVVECRVNGEGHGLDFLLRTLARYDQRATFFVETLCTAFFGDEPMRGYAHRIAEAGHEVGLHLHPCWQAFEDAEWRQRLVDRPADDLYARAPEDIPAVISRGMAIMESWGMPRPTALRMGNLTASRDIYRAMAAVGMPVASNVGAGIHRSPDPSLHLTGGCHDIEGVLELPVTTYELALPFVSTRQRCLTVTGSDFGTTRRLLEAACGPVVVLTHPFEFIKKRDFTFREMRRNRINQRRLETLVSYVSHAAPRFRMSTLSDAAMRQAPAGDRTNLAEAPTLGAATVAPGLVSNRLNDIVWRL